MKWLNFLLLLVIAFLLVFYVFPHSRCCGRCSLPPPVTVQAVDLSRYTGTWYEIAAFPNRFEKGCHCAKADYSLLPSGRMKVLNSCFRDGKQDSFSGVAWNTDETNAKLRVRFYWPFYGNYWILFISPDYHDALVGSPDRDYLWILSRSPKFNQKTYDALAAIAKKQGYPIEKLQITTDKSCESSAS